MNSPKHNEDWIFIIGVWVFIVAAASKGNDFAVAGWVIAFICFMNYSNERDDCELRRREAFDRAALNTIQGETAHSNITGKELQ